MRLQRYAQTTQPKFFGNFRAFDVKPSVWPDRPRQSRQGHRPLVVRLFRQRNATRSTKWQPSRLKNETNSYNSLFSDQENKVPKEQLWVMLFSTISYREVSPLRSSWKEFVVQFFHICTLFYLHWRRSAAPTLCTKDTTEILRNIRALTWNHQFGPTDHVDR